MSQRLSTTKTPKVISRGTQPQQIVRQERLAKSTGSFSNAGSEIEVSDEGREYDQINVESFLRPLVGTVLVLERFGKRDSTTAELGVRSGMQISCFGTFESGRSEDIAEWCVRTSTLKV